LRRCIDEQFERAPFPLTEVSSGNVFRPAIIIAKPRLHRECARFPTGHDWSESSDHIAAALGPSTTAPANATDLQSQILVLWSDPVLPIVHTLSGVRESAEGF
jgi:hypothetical protein